jgi:hypothetical protein
MDPAASSGTVEVFFSFSLGLALYTQHTFRRSPQHMCLGPPPPRRGAEVCSECLIARRPKRAPRTCSSGPGAELWPWSYGCGRGTEPCNIPRDVLHLKVPQGNCGPGHLVDSCGTCCHARVRPPRGLDTVVVLNVPASLPPPRPRVTTNTA